MSLHRPQPLGTAPAPTGQLLLPDVAGVRDVSSLLLRGIVPSEWPSELAFYGTALAGDAEAAAALITGTALVDDYNRAVLVGGPEQWAALLAASEDTAELHSLAQTVAYELGLVDTPPSVAGLDGEFAALVYAAHASQALETDDVPRAIENLARAVGASRDASPILAASLLGSVAELLRDRLDEPNAAYQAANDALALLPEAADVELRATLLMQRGLSLQVASGQSREGLVAAVGDLQEAVRVFRKQTHPEQWAICNQAIALAYLYMPMSSAGDKLRPAVAVTALREVLTVLNPDDNPEMWASVQTNLANALVYLDSAHPVQNLLEAVELYEGSRQIRERLGDELGQARVLTNQANALAHLGEKSMAAERLAAATALFTHIDGPEGELGLATIAEIRAELESGETTVLRDRVPTYSPLPPLDTISAFGEGM